MWTSVVCGRVLNSYPCHINRERLSGNSNKMRHLLLQGLLMEHQKRNSQELGIDSLNDKGWLRYLCYWYKIAWNLLICQTELFQTSSLTFTISEWNKLDPDVRNVKTYLLFRKNLLPFVRPIENSIYSIYDTLGIKLLHRLRLGFSHLREHKFTHNVADTMNPLCSCYLEIESTEYYTLPQLCHLSHSPY